MALKGPSSPFGSYWVLFVDRTERATEGQLAIDLAPCPSSWRMLSALAVPSVPIAIRFFLPRSAEYVSATYLAVTLKSYMKNFCV